VVWFSFWRTSKVIIMKHLFLITDRQSKAEVCVVVESLLLEIPRRHLDMILGNQI